MLPDKDRHARIRRSLALALNHEWPQLDRTRKRVGDPQGLGAPRAGHPDVRRKAGAQRIG